MKIRIPPARLVCLLSACSASFLYAQMASQMQLDKGASLTSTTMAGGSLVGHIYCGDTQLPARMAQVMLRRVPAQGQKTEHASESFSIASARTDLDGAFEMQHVVPGRYYVDAIFPGYVSPGEMVSPQEMASPDPEVQIRVSRSLREVTIRDQDTEQVEITLDRGGALSGKVMYADGSPAADVSMMAVMVNPDGSRGRTVGALQGNGRTDDRGWFRIAGLQPAKYWVVASVSVPGRLHAQAPAKNTSVTDSVVFRNVNVYAPMSYHLPDAEMYEVRSGEDHDGISVQLLLDNLHVVTGAVPRWKDGKRSVRFVTLLDATDNNTFFHGAAVQQDGSFRLEDIPDGEYTLVAGQQHVALSVRGEDVLDITLGTAAAQ